MKDIFELNNYITPTIHIPCKDNELYVKRDDLLPFSFGGNKARIALVLHPVSNNTLRY